MHELSQIQVSSRTVENYTLSIWKQQLHSPLTLSRSY